MVVFQGKGSGSNVDGVGVRESGPLSVLGLYVGLERGSVEEVM